MNRIHSQVLWIIIVIILLIPSSSLLSQKLKRNTAVFLEMNGAGLNYSINLDTRFNRGTQDGFGCRIGLGFDNHNYTLVDLETLTNQGIDLAKEYVLPIEINYIYGKYRNGIEIGIGLSFVYMDFLADDYDYSIGIFNIAEFSQEQNKHVFGFLNIGYRFQALSNGLILKANWTPIFNKNRIFANYSGIALGYKF